MQIAELARRAGVSIKAVRYYEGLGLLTPARLANGYRSYTDEDVRVVDEIRLLTAAGIPPSGAAPFVDCLRTGHDHSDECPTSLAAYRDTIGEIDQLIANLSQRRQVLTDRLHQAAARTFDTIRESIVTDYTVLPAGLPQPVDDGAAAHLPGRAVPDLTLATSDGGTVHLRALPAGRTVIYLYPLTGRPGQDLPDGWDAIPGARGCSTEACDFRDHHQDLQAAGAAAVWGMSSQTVDYQNEVVQRLRLPFAMISDPDFTLADALQLPTFVATGHPRLYSRLTLVVANSRIERVFYPIFPPNTHAYQVLTWLREHPMPR